MKERDAAYWNARHRDWWEGKPRWLVIMLGILAFTPLSLLVLVNIAAYIAASD